MLIVPPFIDAFLPSDFMWFLCHTPSLPSPVSLSSSMSTSVESLYTALRNIDRADIVTSLEAQAPQPAPGSLEEGACRLGDRDSTLLSPSVINGKTHINKHTQTKIKLM